MRTFNIKEIYINKDDPWLGFLTAAEFTIRSTKNNLKGYSRGPIIIETQTNKDIIRENI